MPNKIRIFVAPPSDVAIERAKVDKVVETIKPTADHLDLILEYGLLCQQMFHPNI